MANKDGMNRKGRISSFNSDATTFNLPQNDLSCTLIVAFQAGIQRERERERTKKEIYQPWIEESFLCTSLWMLRWHFRCEATSFHSHLRILHGIWHKSRDSERSKPRRVSLAYYVAVFVVFMRLKWKCVYIIITLAPLTHTPLRSLRNTITYFIPLPRSRLTRFFFVLFFLALLSVASAPYNRGERLITWQSVCCCCFPLLNFNVFLRTTSAAAAAECAD